MKMKTTIQNSRTILPDYNKYLIKELLSIKLCKQLQKDSSEI